MKKSTWIAIGLFAATVAWIGSGYVIPSGDEPDGGETGGARAEPQATLVEVTHSQARSIERYIFSQGTARPFRTLDVTSQVGGPIQQVEVELGDFLKAGAVVGRIKLEARSESRESALATVEALEAELEGIRELEADGFATESQVRELEANLEQARAAVADVQETIEDTVVTSAIPGVVSAIHVNDGQAVSPGSLLVTVIDNTPLRVALQLSQIDVGRIERGTVALVNFATGDSAKGRVCFIAPAADEETRTFLVEVRVPNPDRAIPSRISAELRLKAGEADAHFFSSAFLSLNEQGELGVKSVTEDGRVNFHPATVVRSEPDGVWVTDLPPEIDLITLGQGFVRQGEAVRVAEAEAEAGQAATTPSAQGVDAADPPTASVQSEGIEQASKLPEPPPADELCGLRGADTAGQNVAGQGSSTGAGSSSSSGASGSSGGSTSSGGSAFSAPGPVPTAPTTSQAPAGQGATPPATGTSSPSAPQPMPQTAPPGPAAGSTGPVTGSGGAGPAGPAAPSASGGTPAGGGTP